MNLSINLIKNAAFTSIIVMILTLPILGLPMGMSGIKIVVRENYAVVIYIGISVFILRLLQPFIYKIYTKLPSIPEASHGMQRTIFILLLIFALIYPFIANRTGLGLGVLALIYVTLALGLNVITGFAGLLVLGYAAFYAVGAYTYAILNQFYGWSFWMCLPLAGVIAALTGLVLGLPVLRLRGDYLAIVTLGFGEIMVKLLENADKITGGPDGITSIAKPSVFGLPMVRRVTEGQTFHEYFGLTYKSEHQIILMYVIALLLVIFTFYVTNRLQRLPLGRTWEALREDEIACRSLGLNPAKSKVAAFVIAAFFAGLAGTVFAAHQGSITPSSFGFIESAMILAIVVLGGMGSSIGIVIAAVLVTTLNNAQFLSDYRMLLFGALLIIMMLMRPQGLLPAKRPLLELPKT
ncbi:branched-chain amino acid ABC transporter permease [Gammaproteobacteria bacterium]|nr:branched-chain amino acid ABC transporter permease [Gammaproteobacteria bacterium]